MSTCLRYKYFLSVKKTAEDKHSCPNSFLGLISFRIECLEISSHMSLSVRVEEGVKTLSHSFSVKPKTFPSEQK